MSRASTTQTVGDQITTLLTGFALTTAAREMVSRFVQAEQQSALPLLLDVLLRAPRHRDHLFHAIVITHSTAS